MGMPLFNHTALNLEKIDKKSNQNSIWVAFITSIFIYIFLFYIFNLSPSTVVRTTKFWFILSNTLILIIAADSGAFSCSKNLDEYTKNNVRSEPTLPCFHIKYHKTTSSQVVVDDEQPPEKIIGVVAVDHVKTTTTHQTLHQKPLISITDPKIDRDINIEAGKTGENFDDRNSRVKKMEEENTEDDVALQTTLSEKGEAARLEDEEEFSRMSDEELNTRVEEFIRRVNRQIRLQPPIIPR